MPYVNIKITREEKPVTAEQKAKLIAGVTQLLVDVIDRGPSTTVVVIEEIDMANYGVGGTAVADRRRQGL